ATVATNAATFWASRPWTTAAGMTPWPRHPSSEPLGGLGRQPLLIVWSTVDWAGLSTSRLGPTLPTALAAASVWQTPQCWPNSCRPLFSLAVSLSPPTWALALWWLPVSISSGSPTPKTTAVTTNIVIVTLLPRRPGSRRVG